MPAILELFPPLALALDDEIRKNHHQLAALLARYPQQSLEVKIAAVAAYCNVLTDGWFLERDLEKLLELLLQKLKEKSVLIVQSGSLTKH